MVVVAATTVDSGAYGGTAAQQSSLGHRGCRGDGDEMRGGGALLLRSGHADPARWQGKVEGGIVSLKGNKAVADIVIWP